MNGRYALFFVLFSLGFAAGGAAAAAFPPPAKPEAGIARAHAAAAQGPFMPEWESLKAHRDPEWFRDAKFGIYTHWGPITVATETAPKGMEWYGSQMYQTNHPAFAYHRQRFGDQKTVGYKDVIPQFKAEKFNADEWAEIFARAGAKFAGPVAIHHDHYANWASDLTRWNSRDLGPGRDLTGELAAALRRRGLKLITSFHHGFAWRYYEPAYAFDAADPQWADLYAEPHADKAPPSARFQDIWLGLVQEVLVKYQPDLIWFDFELGTVITPEYQREMFASTYNWAAAAGREIGVTHKHREIHAHTGILDFERGREDKLTDYVWLTDTSLGPWFHHDCLKYRPVGELVDILVDIVSKNGCLLLNVGPRADGTIPDEAKQMLYAMGDWLRINGEAIYGTRPWKIYGEGPTRTKGGGFSERAEKAFTAADVRFTTKGATLFAVALAWPEDRRLRIRSLAEPAGKVERVELLGPAGEVKWKQTAEALEVELPEKAPCDFAVALRIEGRNLQPAPLPPPDTAVGPDARGSFTLAPQAAALEGPKLRVESRNGHDYLAAWDDAKASASWTLKNAATGRYEVAVTCSAVYAATDFIVAVAGQELSATAPKTPGWYDYATVKAGVAVVDKPGVVEVVLRPAKPAAWKAMNVRAVTLTRTD